MTKHRLKRQRMLEVRTTPLKPSYAGAGFTTKTSRKFSPDPDHVSSVLKSSKNRSQKKITLAPTPWDKETDHEDT